jgi:hypothetical protein
LRVDGVASANFFACSTTRLPTSTRSRGGSSSTRRHSRPFSTTAGRCSRASHHRRGRALAFEPRVRAVLQPDRNVPLSGCDAGVPRDLIEKPPQGDRAPPPVELAPNTGRLRRRVPDAERIEDARRGEVGGLRDLRQPSPELPVVVHAVRLLGDPIQVLDPRVPPRVVRGGRSGRCLHDQHGKAERGLC